MGGDNHPKHVEQMADINKLYVVASFCILFDTLNYPSDP